MKLQIKNTLLLAAAVVGLTACNPDTDPKLDVQAFKDSKPVIALGDCAYLVDGVYDFATPYNAAEALPEETEEQQKAKGEAITAVTTTPVSIKWNNVAPTGLKLAVGYDVIFSNNADFDAEDAKTEVVTKVLAPGEDGNYEYLATVNDINNLALKFGADADSGEPYNLFVKVVGELNDVGDPITVESDVKQLVVLPYKVTVEYAAIWFIGKAEGWDIAGKDEFRLFDYTGKGVYEGTFTLSDGTDNYFRFYTQVGDWESNSLGYQEPDQGTDITAEMKNGVYTGDMVNGKGSWCITTNGTYKMTVDVPNMKVRFEAVSGDEEPDLDPSLWQYIYIIGKPQGWNIDSGELTIVDRKGKGIYTGTITLANGAENYFRFYRALGDWESNSIGYQVPDEGTDITGLFVDGVYEGAAVEGKGSWLITTDGTYGIEFNNNDMTVKFTAQ